MLPLRSVTRLPLSLFGGYHPYGGMGFGMAMPMDGALVVRPTQHFIANEENSPFGIPRKHCGSGNSIRNIIVCARGVFYVLSTASRSASL
jgi:hypothetical protein